MFVTQKCDEKLFDKKEIQTLAKGKRFKGPTSMNVVNVS